MQFPDNRVQQVMGLQPVALWDLRDGIEPSLRSVQVGDRDGPIQCHDGRRLDAIEFIVVTENPRPIGDA